jgi:Ca-activated chloride channel homolog
MTTYSMPSFGLVATEGLSRIVLPLKAIQCRFAVAGGQVGVTMTQVFRQENGRALDCVYHFPLPADAAVHACEAFINDRVIRARVQERGQARENAAHHKAQGRRVALVEAERDNLFTLSLANLQPGDLIEVEIRYVQPLGRLGQRCSLEIPLCPGVRYVPGRPLLRSNRGRGWADDTDEVPDASRISPPRIDDGHPDAAIADIRGTIEAAFLLPGSLESPSHALAVEAGDESAAVRLDDHGAVPDRNFVVRWEETPAARTTPRAWTCRRDGQTFALLEIRAPQSATGPAPQPQDVFFLVDRSGSMAGEKWTKAVNALHRCVEALGAGDRAMITFFESTFRDFAEAPLPVADLRADGNFRRIEALGVAGGTELAPAMRHAVALAGRHSAGRRANLVLITDAQVGNEDAVLDELRKAPELPVHCFGIDNALNDALLLALTRQQGGTFHSLNPRDDIATEVAALARTLGQPVLLGLDPGAAWEPAAGRLPDLYAGQVHFAALRTAADVPLALSGRDAAGQPVRVEFTVQPAAGEGPYLQWCRQRLHRLLAEDRSNPAAVELSVAANLICPLTAFVAWDEAEQVAVAEHELLQPSLVQEAFPPPDCCPSRMPLGSPGFPDHRPICYSINGAREYAAEHCDPAPLGKRVSEDPAFRPEIAARPAGFDRRSRALAEWRDLLAEVRRRWPEFWPEGCEILLTTEFPQNKLRTLEKRVHNLQALLAELERAAPGPAGLARWMAELRAALAWMLGKAGGAVAPPAGSRRAAGDALRVFLLAHAKAVRDELKHAEREAGRSS